MRIRLSALTFALLLMLAFVPAILAQTAPKAGTAVKRTSDGKPDFSGLWREGGGGGGNATERSVFQGGNAARRPTRIMLARQLPLTPKGKELVEQYTAGDGEFAGETGAPGDPRYHTPPCGPVSPALGGEIELVQNPKRLLMVYTGSETKWIRQIWIGRQHPKDLTDYEPAWMGHSIGKWDGDTLVVDTVRIKTRPGHMIDANTAAPQGPNLHLVERISLAPDGKLHIDKTFEDPDMYVRPWTKNVVLTKQTNWDEIAEAWEIQDPHTVCEDAKYPSDNDPWFQDKKN